VLELADVKTAIARGYLRVVEQTSDDVAPPTTEATPAPAASGPASTATVRAATGEQPASSSAVMSPPPAGAKPAKEA
jgi:hypothetical protein